MRASLWPISTAIESSAPAITAAVIGSTRVRTALTGAPPFVRIRFPERVRPRPPGGRDDGGRVAVEDDRGAGIGSSSGSSWRSKKPAS